MRMSSSERSVGGSSGSCQDCGNKAKRECEHMRCRTCCKSRGFFCPTHVKSTWVPVSRRRHSHHHHHHHRLSLLLQTPNFPSPTGLGGGNYQGLPSEINTVANFRRVRVNSGDNEVNETAYQASVMIGGHLFKGIIYDQGSSSSAMPGGSGGGGGEGSSADYYHNHHQYQLATGMTSSAAHVGDPSGGANPQPPQPYTSSNPNMIPHHEYNFYDGSSTSTSHHHVPAAAAAAFNASLLPPGMQFFPHPKP